MKILLKAKLSSPAMDLSLCNASRIPEGFPIPIHLLLHRILDKANLDLVAFDDLAELREVFMPSEGRTDSLHKNIIWL